MNCRVNKQIPGDSSRPRFLKSESSFFPFCTVVLDSRCSTQGLMGGFQPAFKWTSFDRSLGSVRSVKWTEPMQESELINSFNRTGSKVVQIGRWNGMGSCLYKWRMSSKFCVQNRTERRENLIFPFLDIFAFGETINGQRTFSFELETIFHCVKWCHTICDQWFLLQIS